ncbi:MAG: AAA family ATPase [Isosphaeraceae bacterium]
MIQSVHIKNYRGFQEINVPLCPLTVLIGANDTGKSSFISALTRLFNPERITHLDLANNNPAEPIFIEARLEEQTSIQKKWKFSYLGDGNWVHTGEKPWNDPPPHFNKLAQIQLPTAGPTMISNGLPDSVGANELGGDGSGVPALLDYLLRRDRNRFFKFVEAMRGQVPGLDDINIRTPEASKRSLEFVINGGLIIPASEASAGVRLLLYYMAQVFHPNPPDILLIEEPENGIHPKRLKEVVRLLRGIATGGHTGHPSQVILSTHSPYLLDFVIPEVDQVLVFRRKEDGSRTVDPLDGERLREFLENEFLLGEIWFNQGEEGLVKKGAL